ncbi:MAG: hypothetical protein FJ279_10925 [Planctomycetes bacterium]|nr:hypothetical protein [Planctomycetota bacterium]
MDMMAKEKKRETPLILNDEPVGAGETAYFRFNAYADTLARLIAAKSTRTPLTIGIFGDWGTGKTTLMKAVQSRLDETSELDKCSFLSPDEKGDFRWCRTVWFNAWKYGGRPEETQVALIDAIVSQMGKDNLVDTAVLAASQHKKRLASVAQALLGAVLKSKTGGNPGLDLANFEAEARFRQQMPVLDEFRVLFDKLLVWYLRRGELPFKIDLAEVGPEDLKLLDQTAVMAIFIDDLDRCLPAATVKVLEAIKLMVGRPETVFVLGASEGVVQEAIRIHYKEQEKTLAAEHQQYLEKLIQVRFELPRIRTKDVEDFVDALHKGRKLDDTLRPNLPLIVEGVSTNPRRIKTFINYLELQWALLANSGQAKELDRAVLTRWLVLDTAGRLPGKQSFTDFVRQLPPTERPEFIQKAQALAKEGKDRETWPRNLYPRLWAVLRHESFSFEVKPEVVDLLIHLSAPPVEASSEPKPPAVQPEPGASARPTPERAAPRPYRPETLMPDLVDVPAGSFLMGSAQDDPDASSNEKPQFRNRLPAYRIGRYPVTNAEFDRFVKAKGYEHRSLWTDAGWGWRADRTDREHYRGEFDKPDHPAVGVSWFEAVAYCKWLTHTLRASGQLTKSELIRLPSESEWEKAARGEHGRKWPWGNEFDPKKANTVVGAGALLCTTPVGLYSPAGDSPYGCADMAGNVWEWCQTKWLRDYRYYHYGEDGEDRESLRGDVGRVVRGGEWGGDARRCRATYRHVYGPSLRSDDVGFRVVSALAGSR